MKILLRDAETHRFKGKKGEWTCEMVDAVRFATLEAAGEEALSFKEQDLEVVLQYEEPPSALALNPIYCVRQVRTSRLSSWRPSIAA